MGGVDFDAAAIPTAATPNKIQSHGFRQLLDTQPSLPRGVSGQGSGIDFTSAQSVVRRR